MKESMDPSWRYYGGMAVMVMVDCMFRYYLEIWNMIGYRIGGLDLGGGGTPPLPNKIWEGGARRSGTV